MRPMMGGVFAVFFSLVYVAIVIYSILLLKRFVEAVERISDKIK